MSQTFQCHHHATPPNLALLPQKAPNVPRLLLTLLAAMTKPFAQCSLPDLALEISLAACAAACSARRCRRRAAPAGPHRCGGDGGGAAAAERHPLVRGASGLVCTGTAESRQAWCSMLRDLISAAGRHQGNVPAAAGFARLDHPDGAVNSICANTKEQCLETSVSLLDY
jgi:hypothetical protein